MNLLDWLIISLYVGIILAIGFYLSRKQRNQIDYYLAGRSVLPWQIALSMVATQVSAISLVGAPAFIALKKGGGLFWLQYEFAVPVAMIFIMCTVVPIYHKFNVISIYEYLEERFGARIRSILSFVFMMSRSLAAGVALLATSIVVSVMMKLPLTTTVIAVGTIAIIYTTMGGIRADIYSDILQLFVLWISALVLLFILISHTEGIISDPERYRIFKIGTGLADREVYGFWPMLIGGIFLYLSYYGCDQSETQRLLTARGVSQAQKALLINGMLRFPLVITYCGVGIFILSFMKQHPEFANMVSREKPDFLVPTFLLHYMPHGLLGLAVAGIFAASMSSLDSTLNSLSAVTWRDFLQKRYRCSVKKELFFSKLLTLLWGLLCTLFAIYMAEGPETVLVLVNKIGSAFYGPILATFWLGIFTDRANEQGAIAGLIVGVLTNIFLWLFLGDLISWFWWNPIGFFVSFSLGYIISLFFPSNKKGNKEMLFSYRPPFKYVILLSFTFIAIILICLCLQKILLK